MLASYCTAVSVQMFSEHLSKTIPSLSLLALSLSEKIATDDTPPLENELKSNLIKFRGSCAVFQGSFPFFGVEFDDWCLSLIDGSTSANHRVARESGRHSIGCSSHKLNIEVNLMIENHHELCNAIESAHETMRAAKQLKNATLLRKITELEPSCIIRRGDPESSRC